MARFGPSEYTNFDESLAHIKQSGTLREYQKEFERLANRVRDWPETALVGAFMGGLKPDLAAEVRVHRPRTYTEAIEIARVRDDYLSLTKRSGKTEFRRTGMYNTESRPTVGKNSEEIQETAAKILTTGIKRLPWDELQKRREKGLCFNCDEKFVTGHRCKMKQAYLIEPVSSSEEDAPEMENKGEDAAISIHAMAGTSGPRTMRLGSWLKGRRIIVLVDNGSTHNFIDQELVRRLQLPTVTIDPFKVRVANGDQLICDKLYKNIRIRI